MWPFKKKPKIKIGQVWAHDTRNPFNTATVTVVDVQKGYVQYRYDGHKNNYLGDMDISSFVWIYDLSKEAPDADKS